MRTLVVTVLVWMLLLSLGAGAALADPGSSSGNGRGRGQPQDVARPHDRRGNPGDDGNDIVASEPGRGNGNGSANGQGGSGGTVTRVPTRPPAGDVVRPRVFSVQGTFVGWVAQSDDLESAYMEIEVISCNRAVRDAVIGDDGDLLHVEIDDQTRYHVLGGGGGFSTGLARANIPDGARLHIVGTASHAETGTGGVTEAPVLLYATRVLVQLNVVAEDRAGG